MASEVVRAYFDGWVEEKHPVVRKDRRQRVIEVGRSNWLSIA